MENNLVDLIVERLDRDREQLREKFKTSTGVAQHAVVDDLLPHDIAQRLSEEFPDLGEMRLLSSIRERKHTSKDVGPKGSLLADATYSFQHPSVIALLEDITGIPNLIGDPYLYAGGVSAMTKGHYLHPHIDNSHDSKRETYRRLNLLYYISPSWQPRYGGNLELWALSGKRLSHRVELPSSFNRLVIMNTNRTSYHSVSEVQADLRRLCISNYFFSLESPEAHDYFHVTSYKGRPERPVQRAILAGDSKARTALRKLKKAGFARRDINPAVPND